MGYTERIRLIQQIEEIRGSHTVVYFTSDRQPLLARIAEDAVLPLYKQLLALITANPDKHKIDVFLYSRGGDVSVPWRIVSMLREVCEEFSVLIPYKAYSATTMISLGADQIVMGRKAELGPIDPTLSRVVTGEATSPPPEISVEDVSSYISFMRERANINDQAALAQVVSELANHLTPLTLGSVNRMYSHIRLVARKLLTSRKEKIDEDRISTIIDALTEKMYSHGHGIGRQEAFDLGLPVEKAQGEIEVLMWSLYSEYEEFFNLNEPFDPEELIANAQADSYEQPGYPLAIIESTQRQFVFRGKAVVRARRQIPPNLPINCNVQLQLNAPNLDQQPTPPEIQALTQQLIGLVSQAAPQIVRQEIVRQCPIQGYEIKLTGAKWEDSTASPV